MAELVGEFQSVVDDAILLLATAHRASFDADLTARPDEDDVDEADNAAQGRASAARTGKNNNRVGSGRVDKEEHDGEAASDSDDEDDEDNDPEADDAELQLLRWEAVAQGVAAVVRAVAAGRTKERDLHASREATTAAALGTHHHHQAPSQEASSLPVADAPSCLERARYLIWRRHRQEEEERAATAKQVAAAGRKTTKSSAVAVVSSFNVLRGDSVSARVESILKQATRSLPSTLDANGKVIGIDDDDDDDTPVEIYQPPAHFNLSEAELAERTAMLAAEDDLMQKVQQMQLAHWDKFKKWIDIDPTGALKHKPLLDQQQLQQARDNQTTPDISQRRAKSQLTPASGRSPDSVDARMQHQRRIEDYSPEEVVDLCRGLGIDGDSLRRTNGRMLSTLTSADLALRMPEASDEQRQRLLQAVQARRGGGRSATASSTAASSSAGGAFGARARGEVGQLFAATRGGQASALAQMLADAAAPPAAGLSEQEAAVQELRRRLAAMTSSSASATSTGRPTGGPTGSGRPVRPSQMTDEDYENAAADLDDDEGDVAASARVPARRPPAAAAAAPPAAHSGRGGWHADPTAAPVGRGGAAPVRKTTAPPARGANRWIIEEDQSDGFREDSD